MTIDERAEKMAREYANNFNLNQDDELALAKDIAAEIQEAVEEETVRTRKILDSNIDKAFKHGKAEAYEEAAKILELWDAHQHSVSEIVERIRALAAEEGK